MGPSAAADCDDVPRLIDELVPGIAAVVDDVVVGCEDAVSEPVVAHELPDVFNPVQFGASRRQSDDAELVGYELQIPRAATGPGRSTTSEQRHGSPGSDRARPLRQRGRACRCL